MCGGGCGGAWEVWRLMDSGVEREIRHLVWRQGYRPTTPLPASQYPSPYGTQYIQSGALALGWRASLRRQRQYPCRLRPAATLEDINVGREM